MCEVLALLALLANSNAKASAITFAVISAVSATGTVLTYSGKIAVSQKVPDNTVRTQPESDKLYFIFIT